MLGIDKATFIRAIQKADIDIITEIDIEDLFCDLGKDCSYNDDGIVEFDDISNFTEKHKKEEKDEAKLKEWQKDDRSYYIPPIRKTMTKEEEIIAYGPSIVCYNCPTKCNNQENCSIYRNAKMTYNILNAK